jgi:hypothetical protein
MKKAILLILISFFSITEIYSCTCIDRTKEFISKKVKRAFNQADLIVSGKVIEIKIVNKAKPKYYERNKKS